MKLTIKTDLESQAKYLCFLAKHIQTGTYQKTDLSILPYPIKGHCVYFPDLDYPKDFWRSIKKSKGLHLTSLRNNELRMSVKSILTTIVSGKELDIKTQKLKDYWKVNYKSFFKIADKVFGKDFEQDIKEIEILITPFGTTGSFFNKGNKTFVTYRIDLPYESVFKTLLNAFIRRKLNYLTETGTARFTDRQKYLTFLLKNTAFSTFFSKNQKVHLRN